MRASGIGDPRLQELFGPEAAPVAGVKPIIRVSRDGPSGWVIAAFALGTALLLFWILESRREAQPEPQVRPRGETAIFSPEPPPLYIPPAPVPPPPPTELQPASQPDVAPSPRAARPPFTAPLTYAPPALAPLSRVTSPYVSAPRPSAGPALVIDTTGPAKATDQNGSGGRSAGAAAASSWGGRARAGSLSDKANTVPQGTLIPAVLETAFDSTSASLARAVVSRDVRGFDGSRILIPRGSRLIGEFRADVAAGQNRALINWTRLIRPDGVAIALDSPATDTLGRGGIKAQVNSHFWTRLGDAVLGSAASIGSGLATRAATGSVIVSVGGSAPQQAARSQSSRVVPTLSVRAATSISVFVARDLEFPRRKEEE
jgi:type IV secretion system protein VirB10